MTIILVRDTINTRIEEADNPELTAKLEIIREYLTNPTFRQNLHDYVWEKTKP